jgi:hypothetical protein
MTTDHADARAQLTPTQAVLARMINEVLHCERLMYLEYVRRFYRDRRRSAFFALWRRRRRDAVRVTVLEAHVADRAPDLRVGSQEEGEVALALFGFLLGVISFCLMLLG